MVWKEIKANMFTIKILCLISFAVAMVFLSGCSGTANIPTASMAESGEVGVSWEEVPGARSYNIYISTSPGVTKLSGYRIARVSSPLTVTSLETGTTYYFVLTVIDDSGEGQESNEVAYRAVQEETGSIKLIPKINEAIPKTQNKKVEKNSKSRKQTGKSQKSTGARTNNQITGETVKPELPVEKPASSEKKKDPDIASGKMTVAWDTVPNAVSYNLYWNTAPGVTKQNGNQITGVTSPYTFTGLTRGVTYYFVVTAVGHDGESQESAEFSFSTPK